MSPLVATSRVDAGFVNSSYAAFISGTRLLAMGNMPAVSVAPELDVEICITLR